MDLEIVEFRKSEHERKHYEYYGGRAHRAERGDRPDDHSRVFVSIESETFWENFADRTSRPHAAWRPYVIQALKDEGIEFKNIRWSQKAGCKMCPCSPGFYVHGHTGEDYWLTLRVHERQTTNADESEFRLNQLLSDPTITGALQ